MTLELDELDDMHPDSAVVLNPRPEHLGTLREGEPPRDHEVWIEGNLILKDGCFVTVEPFRCRARWKDEVSFRRDDGTVAPGWIGEDGLTLCMSIDDEIAVHRWADLEVRFELKLSPRMVRRSGRPTIAALPAPGWHTDTGDLDRSPQVFEFLKGISDRELLDLRACQQRFLDEARPWRRQGLLRWLPWEEADRLYRNAETVEYWILREIEERFAAALEKRECAARRASLTRRWKKSQPTTVNAPARRAA